LLLPHVLANSKSSSFHPSCGVKNTDKGFINLQIIQEYDNLGSDQKLDFEWQGDRFNYNYFDFELLKIKTMILPINHFATIKSFEKCRYKIYTITNLQDHRVGDITLHLP